VKGGREGKAEKATGNFGHRRHGGHQEGFLGAGVKKEGVFKKTGGAKSGRGRKERPKRTPGGARRKGGTVAN